MRQSVKSLAASENQSLNESAIAGAIADYYLRNGSSAGRAEQLLAQSLDSQSLRQITEDLVIQKINKIFEEAARDNTEFDESYTALKRPIPAQKISTSHSQVDSSNKEISQSLLEQPKTKKVSIQEQQ